MMNLKDKQLKGFVDFDYLIGQKNVSIFRRTKLFVGQNFSHLQNISSLLSDEKFILQTFYLFQQ